MVAQHAGFASHPVPMEGLQIRLPAGPGVRRRMEAALRAAEREWRRIDASVSVRCCREVTTKERAEGYYDHERGCRMVRRIRTVETHTRHGREWRTYATDTIVGAYAPERGRPARG